MSVYDGIGAMKAEEQRDALRAAMESLRDECLREAAIDTKGRAYTSASVREWCAARIDQVLRGVL